MTTTNQTTVPAAVAMPDHVAETLRQIAAINPRDTSGRWLLGRVMNQLPTFGHHRPMVESAVRWKACSRQITDCRLVQRCFPISENVDAWTRRGMTWASLRVLASPSLTDSDRESLIEDFEARTIGNRELRARAEIIRRQRTTRPARGPSLPPGAEGAAMRRNLDALSRQIDRVLARLPETRAMLITLDASSPVGDVPIVRRIRDNAASLVAEAARLGSAIDGLGRPCRRRSRS